MNETLNINQPEAKKLSKHLIEGVKPIYVCLGTQDEIGLFIDEDYPPEGHNVKYNDVRGNADKQFLQTEGAQCVISTIDSLNKFSLDFFRCTGLVVAGIEKENGNPISFLSHQDPSFFLFNPKKEDFKSGLEKSLSEIKERCIPGTIDAVIVGGNYPEDSEHDRQQYLDSINFLSSQIKQNLGFEPVIVNGPKKSSFTTDEIYYNNNNRRLYFSRTKINPEMGSFTASDISNNKK